MDSPLPQAQLLIDGIESALAESAPQRAQPTAGKLDQLIRQHDWSPDQLSALRDQLRHSMSAGVALRQELLAELRDRRRKRSHLNHYQRVEQSR